MLQVSYYVQIFNSVLFGMLSVFQFLFILRGLYIALDCSIVMYQYHVPEKSILCTVNLIHIQFQFYFICYLFFILYFIVFYNI